jgi:hypothetical protein
VDRVHLEGYLGEKGLESYSERYQPLIFQDIYQGKMSFADEIFFQNFFQDYLFHNERDYSFFFRSELNSGMNCSNELLSQHFDDIRYSYRLITLSYLLEGQWHNQLISKHLRLKEGCRFDLKSWVKTCQAKSLQMQKFIKRLEEYGPRYDEKIPNSYSKEDWLKEFKTNNFKWYSHYRLKAQCKDKCDEENIALNFQKSCESDEKIMTMICSEMDEVYGLSTNRDAYNLLGQSNIINTYNKRGEAMGCLRRFSEVMAHKEVRFEVLNHLFPSLQTFLRKYYNERFIQGRVFFFGSSKEFEDKGLSEFHVKEQPIKIEKAIKEPKVAVKADPVKIEEVKTTKSTSKPVVVVATEPTKVPVREIRKPTKSAFLQAAEIRSLGNLDRVEVDMAKFKYDYTFSLNMINTLSERLKSFMGREALVEMMKYDKLGTKEGPVPLMFLKFMIDMQEHHGLWNISSTLGNKFYVSNEIDASFTPIPELVQLVNNETTGGQWQLFILRPN